MNVTNGFEKKKKCFTEHFPHIGFLCERRKSVVCFVYSVSSFQFMISFISVVDFFFSTCIIVDSRIIVL